MTKPKKPKVTKIPRFLIGHKWHRYANIKNWITPLVDRNAKARSKAEDLKLELELRKELEGY